MRLLSSAASALALLAACGPAPHGSAGGDAAPPDSTSVQGPRDVLVHARQLPDEAYAEGAQRLELLVAAASAVAPSNPPHTGRIEVDGDQIRYDAAPTDSLEISYAGQTWTFVVHEVRGGSTDGFFEGDHRLRVSSTGPGGALELSSTRAGVNREAHVGGTLEFDGQSCAVDLTWVGTERFETDSSGTQHLLDTTVAGTAACPDFGMTVSEHWRFELVSARGGYVAQTAERWTDGGLWTDAHRYDFTNLVTRAAFRDGKPTELDTYWRATGAVLRDGQAWGTLSLSPHVVTEDGGFVQFVLQAPGIAPIVLQQFNVY